jgi:hypothetical protein
VSDDTLQIHPIRIYTIGFAGHSAEEFFGKLQAAGVKTLVDVRLNNVSQLAGFAKKQDLEYFLRTIAGIGYLHETSLAPTREILDDYKKKRITWEDYEIEFNRLLNERRPDEHLAREELDRACGTAGKDGRRLALDLSGVTFVDRPGVALLRRLAGRLVTLRNHSPFVAELLRS